MCSALSPDRDPRPPSREPLFTTDRGGACAVNPALERLSPGEPGRAEEWAEERAFRRRSPRLTFPPSCHSRTRFFNWIPNVPAPKFWTLEAKTVNAARIGGLRLLEGGDNGARSEFLLAAVLSLGSPAQAVLPRPLEGDLEDARERALSPSAAAARAGTAARAPARKTGSRRRLLADPLLL